MFTLVCRRQFDLANREAVDESAEWRRMFDSEAEKASKCNSELALVLSSKLLLHVAKVFFFFFLEHCFFLVQMKESSGNGNAFTLNQKLESLHKVTLPFPNRHSL